jgi:hypothetical protein
MAAQKNFESLKVEALAAEQAYQNACKKSRDLGQQLNEAKKSERRLQAVYMELAAAALSASQTTK